MVVQIYCLSFKITSKLTFSSAWEFLAEKLPVPYRFATGWQSFWTPLKRHWGFQSLHSPDLCGLLGFLFAAFSPAAILLHPSASHTTFDVSFLWVLFVLWSSTTEAACLLQSDMGLFVPFVNLKGLSGLWLSSFLIL